MKGHFVKLTIVSILFGAMTTVAVAWWCGAFIDPQGRFWIQIPAAWKADKDYWEISRFEAPGATAIYSLRATAIEEYLSDWDPYHEPEEALPYWSSFDEPTAEYLKSSLEEVTNESGWAQEERYESGWGLPFRSMKNEFVISSGTIDGIGLPQNGMRAVPRVLPLRIIPLGFALDSIFFSGPWFLLFWSIGEHRRRRRTKRGLCVECGYDLRNDFETGCPECGWNRAEAADDVAGGGGSGGAGG